MRHSIPVRLGLLVSISFVCWACISSREVLPERSTPVPTVVQPINDLIAEKLRNFIEGLPNCDLPCFWGIIPSETTIDEFDSIFSPLGSLEYGEFLGAKPSAFFIASVYLDDEQTNPASISVYSFNGVTVDAISARTILSTKYAQFTFKDFFELFGTPEKVYVNIRTISPFAPFARFLAIYPDRGLSIESSSTNQAIKFSEEAATFCPNLSNDFYLTLWEPNDHMTAAWSIEAYREEGFVEIETVSELTSEKFYDLTLLSECFEAETSP